MCHRNPITIQRQSIYRVLKFQSCNLCHGKSNCCPHVSSCNIPIVIPQNYTYWTRLINILQYHRRQGDVVRLITERFLPDEVIWVAAYSELNVLQVNINVLQNWESIKWGIKMAHKAERCGIGCVCMVYPVIPSHVKTYQVLQLIDAISDCMHCKVMIRFGDFKNPGLSVYSGFINLQGREVPLSWVHRIKGNFWGCTNEYKSQFMEYLKFYADVSAIDVRMCEVIR